MVGVCVGKDAPWGSLNHQLHGAQDGDAESIDGAGVLEQSAVLFQVVAFRPLVSLRHFPELDRLVCKAKKVILKRGIWSPSSLVFVLTIAQTNFIFGLFLK